MLLTIGTTYRPATDLGFLLHKHPARCQTFRLGAGQAHIFYTAASDDECRAVLLLEIDPVALVRGRGKASGALEHYVNDRPYVASSYLSTAIAAVYRSALNGHCRDRPELAATPIPLTAHLPVVPSRGGPDLVGRLFAPLGYDVTAVRLPLDPHFPEWGESRCYDVTLRATIRLADLLTHLYVLLPVLDDDKHYFIGQDELDKLLQRGEGWLADHPDYRLISRRYLGGYQSLYRQALLQLSEQQTDPEAEAEAQDAEEARVEKPITLHKQRMTAVLDALKASGARRVLDLGCGEGQLLRLLLDDPQFVEIVGVDVSPWALEKAARRLRLDRLPPAQRARITLLSGALTYRDRRLAGYDAAALVEVIEHVDPDRLPALSRVVFGEMRSALVVVTTPNREYNALFDSLPAGQLRHRDHRFEWTRAEFKAWAEEVATQYGYAVVVDTIGPVDATHGAPSQLARFTRQEAEITS